MAMLHSPMVSGRGLCSEDTAAGGGGGLREKWFYFPHTHSIEYLWRKTKKWATYNKYCKEFAAVVVSIDKVLAYFAAHPEMVLELLGLYCKESAFELKQVA